MVFDQFGVFLSIHGIKRKFTAVTRTITTLDEDRFTE